MLIGILSDSHGRAEALRAALEILSAGGAEFFIHCGDIGGPQMLDYLAGLPSAFVFGNTDWDRDHLRRMAGHLGVQCLGTFGELELAGRRLAVLHGDDFALKQRLVAEQKHDYVLFGHTHICEVTQIGRLRLINPGALHRAREKTAALLDTATDQVKRIVVPGV